MIFRKTYKHKCPDGSTKIVYRNVDDAFPLALKDLEAKFSTELNALAAGVQGQVGSELRSQVAGWLFQFNDSNQSLLASFRAIYTGYQSDPCQHADSYMRAVEKTVDEVNRQTRLQAQLKGLLELSQQQDANHADIIRQFERICQAADGGDVAGAAGSAVKEARDDASRWLQQAAEPSDQEEG